MTQRELADYCLTLPGLYEDWPFEGGEWLAIRHRENKRSCAFLYERNGELCLNLKCEPMQADFWRGVYAGVRPGWHMNKTHWNTVVMDSDVPWEEVCGMLRHSYELTAPRRRKSGREGTPCR